MELTPNLAYVPTVSTNCKKQDIELHKNEAYVYTMSANPGGTTSLSMSDSHYDYVISLPST